MSVAKRRNKDAKPSKKNHPIKEDSVEFILDSDEAQNNNTKPEPSLTLQYRRQHLTQITSHDNSPGISDLQQQSLLQSQSQQSQRLQQQPQSREENPQNSFKDQSLNKQQLFDLEQSKPQEPPQQNQTETQLHQPQHLKKQELARQKLKQPLQRQQQNPELFRRTSDWDEIRTPEGRIIPTFQGERRPLQPKAKELRLLPHPDFYISPSLPEYHTLSERQLATSNLVLFETISKRQPSAPQLEQRTARRHSIIETPRGPQRASQIQYQNMERRMSQISQKYQPQRDHNLSLPNTPQRGVTVRENKTTQNTPLRIPQNDQRRPSQEYRLNQGQNLEPPQREIWQQPSTSQFSGPLQVQPRNFASSSQCIPGLSQNQSQNYSSPIHGVVSQAPIQNYLAASQCVVGASQYYGNSSHSVTGPSHGISHYHHASSTQAISGPTPGPSQYHGSSTQSISGPTPGPSQYYKSSTQSISGPTPGPSQYYKSSTQSISGPTPGPSQYHKSSTQSISGPTPGVSQYHANSAQSVVGEAKYRGTLIQSGSGYDQSPLQYNRNPQSVPAPTHGQKYRASTSQSVAGLNRGQSNYQGHSSLTISVPTQGHVQCPSNTGQAITHTVSGTTQSQSHYHASAKKCASDSSQSSNVLSQDSSQCKASSTKGNLNSSDVSVKHIVGPSHGVTETSQNQVQNVTPDRNTPGPSQNNDNSSQRDTNSTQSITQNNSSSSKGAIPKNYRGQKNDVSNKGITQSTASLSINVAGSSEKTKETSRNAASSSEKTKETSQNAASSSEKTKETSQNAASSSEKTKETSQNAASSSEKTKETSQNAASSSEKTNETSQNAAGPSNKVVEALKPKPSPPTKVTGPSKSASTSAKAKGAQNATTTGPQPLMSSYSQLVSTLSKNKELPMFQPFPPLEVNDTPVETPKEMPKSSGPFAVLANTIPHAATIFAKMKNTILGSSNENMNSQPLEYNPIMQKFEVQEEVCNAGPGQVWRVHDAIRKVDALIRKLPSRIDYLDLALDREKHNEHYSKRHVRHNRLIVNFSIK
ncbi:unnamed protein product [Pieris macdunnoughi]|uniref:Uncharacterized protein n=1 Tax=Pieris macdunnoughi TaxID=345717 RepID=A0A821LJB0_9NEOP|nr:unnamed protein product [Pieris macdunnoughi]